MLHCFAPIVETHFQRHFLDQNKCCCFFLLFFSLIRPFLRGRAFSNSGCHTKTDKKSELTHTINVDPDTQQEKEREQWHLDEIWHRSHATHVVRYNLRSCKGGVGFKQLFCLATFMGSLKGKCSAGRYDEYFNAVRHQQFMCSIRSFSLL